jgi:hypothetical protein
MKNNLGDIFYMYISIYIFLLETVIDKIFVSKSITMTIKDCNSLLMRTSVLLVLIILFIMMYNYIEYDTFNVKRVKSELDGEIYKVHLGHENYVEAAEVLAQINYNNITLLRHLKKKYKPYDGGVFLNPDMQRIRGKVKFLLDNYNPDRITENSPKNATDSTSYTIGKGDVLALCLRKKQVGEKYSFHEMSILMFVTIHELAHMMTREMHHKYPFWVNFKILLNEAVECGVYEYEDYALNPVMYCGMNITYNPLTDKELNTGSGYVINPYGGPKK